jgi:hypothetical protein
MVMKISAGCGAADAGGAVVAVAAGGFCARAELELTRHAAKTRAERVKRRSFTTRDLLIGRPFKGPLALTYGRRRAEVKCGETFLSERTG